MAQLTRKISFSAAHRLHSPEMSPEENDKLFGPCARPNFHGHNYTAWVSVKGQIDPRTGIVFNLADLKQILESEIREAFDHRNLNLDLPEFKTLNPSAENIALVLWNRLKPKIPLLSEVRLEETENNSVVYRGE